MILFFLSFFHYHSESSWHLPLLTMKPGQRKCSLCAHIIASINRLPLLLVPQTVTDYCCKLLPLLYCSPTLFCSLTLCSWIMLCNSTILKLSIIWAAASLLVSITLTSISSSDLWPQLLLSSLNTLRIYSTCFTFILTSSLSKSSLRLE